MQFSCKKCGKLLGPEVMLSIERRCSCGRVFQDPFRGYRRLFKILKKKRLNEK